MDKDNTRRKKDKGSVKDTRRSPINRAKKGDNYNDKIGGQAGMAGGGRTSRRIQARMTHRDKAISLEG